MMKLIEVKRINKKYFKEKKKESQNENIKAKETIMTKFTK